MPLHIAADSCCFATFSPVACQALEVVYLGLGSCPKATCCTAFLHQPPRWLVDKVRTCSTRQRSVNSHGAAFSEYPLCLPCRLLPALLRFAEDGAPPECQAHALRFVEFCIHHLENDDPAIHHLAVASSTLRSMAFNPSAPSVYHEL